MGTSWGGRGRSGGASDWNDVRHTDYALDWMTKSDVEAKHSTVEPIALVEYPFVLCYYDTLLYFITLDVVVGTC